MARAAREMNVPHVVYLSSTVVYGQTTEDADETHIVEPLTNYGTTKLRGEEHMAILEDYSKVQIIRAGNVYGFNPCIRLDTVINRFVFEAHYLGRLTVHGNGEQNRAFIELKKLANAMASLKDESIPPGVYNLVEHNLSVNEIVHLLKDELYPDLETVYTNPYHKIWDFRIKTPCRLFDHLPFTVGSLRDEIREMTSVFKFHGHSNG